MPLPLIPIAIALATKFIPSLLGKIFGDKTGKVAGAVVEIARDVTGELTADEALVGVISNDPEKLTAFQKAANDLELSLYQEDTHRLEIVNTTMQAESRSESKWQRAWRPFNGFLFGITIFFDYFVSQGLQASLESTFPWEHVPIPVYLLWSTVLGVTAYTRGKEKITRAGGIQSLITNLLGK